MHNIRYKKNEKNELFFFRGGWGLNPGNLGNNEFLKFGKIIHRNINSYWKSLFMLFFLSFVCNETPKWFLWPSFYFV